MPEEDPYQPPEAPLVTQPVEQTSIWWKVLFWLTLLLMVLSTIGLPLIENLSWFDYLDYLLSIVATVGLFGFAFSRRIGTVVFWRYFFYVVLLESFIFSVLFPLFGIPSYGDVTPLGGWYAFGLAYTVALLWAIYHYAYRRPLLWGIPPPGS